jgi:hypothetical protein
MTEGKVEELEKMVDKVLLVLGIVERFERLA